VGVPLTDPVCPCVVVTRARTPPRILTQPIDYTPIDRRDAATKTPTIIEAAAATGGAARAAAVVGASCGGSRSRLRLRASLAAAARVSELSMRRLIDQSIESSTRADLNKSTPHIAPTTHTPGRSPPATTTLGISTRTRWRRATARRRHRPTCWPAFSRGRRPGARAVGTAAGIGRGEFVVWMWVDGRVE
jgi:hypothetical protein